MTARIVQERLRSLSSPEAAAAAARYFKTGPGEYGEGDIFLGLRAAVMHRSGQGNRHSRSVELKSLLRSAIHEDRLLALLILVRQASESDESTKKRVYKLYLAHTRYINNWDLVDASAPEIVGGYLASKSREPLGSTGGIAEPVGAADQHCRHPLFHPSKRLRRHAPDRRAASGDREDLIHKAVGWMLREVGKRQQLTLESFLRRHGRSCPGPCCAMPSSGFRQTAASLLDGSACD